MTKNSNEKVIYIRKKMKDGKRKWLPIGKVIGKRIDGKPPWIRNWILESDVPQNVLQAIMNVYDVEYSPKESEIIDEYFGF